MIERDETAGLVLQIAIARSHTAKQTPCTSTKENGSTNFVRAIMPGASAIDGVLRYYHYIKLALLPHQLLVSICGCIWTSTM